MASAQLEKTPCMSLRLMLSSPETWPRQHNFIKERLCNADELTGSAMAMRKSYACLYSGEYVSRKMRPSGHTHNGL